MKKAMAVMAAVGLAAGIASGAIPNKTVTIKPVSPTESASKSVQPADEPLPVKPETAGGAAAVPAAATTTAAVPAGYAGIVQKLGLAKVTRYRVQDKRVGVLEDGGYLLLTDDYLKVDGQRGPSLLAVVLDAKGAVKRVSLVKSPDDASLVRLVVPNLKVLEKQSVTTEEEARPSLVIPGAVESSVGMQRTVNGTMEMFKPVFRKLAVKDGVLNYDGAPLAPEPEDAPPPPAAGAR